MRLCAAVASADAISNKLFGRCHCIALPLPPSRPTHLELVLGVVDTGSARVRPGSTIFEQTPSAVGVPRRQANLNIRWRRERSVTAGWRRGQLMPLISLAGRRHDYTITLFSPAGRDHWLYREARPLADWKRRWSGRFRWFRRRWRRPSVGRPCRSCRSSDHSAHRSCWPLP